MNLSPVSTVGVIGAGTMGVGIAYVFAEAGCEVYLVEPDEPRSAAALQTIAERADRLAQAGRLPSEQSVRIKAAVTAVAHIGSLPRDLDLIVEAVPEIAKLKHAVLTEAESREPAILATNTSALGIALLGENLTRPERLIGMHFFNPVWSMPLLELIKGRGTLTTTVEAAERIGAFIGKETIVVNDVPGFATSRLGVAIGLEAIRMVEDGVASPADIDRAMELGYRHPMGPLRLTDLVGLDIRLHIARQLSQSLGARFDPPQLLVDKVDRGEMGKKSGRGFFEWKQK